MIETRLDEKGLGKNKKEFVPRTCECRLGKQKNRTNDNRTEIGIYKKKGQKKDEIKKKGLIVGEVKMSRERQKIVGVYEACTRNLTQNKKLRMENFRVSKLKITS